MLELGATYIHLKHAENDDFSIIHKFARCPLGRVYTSVPVDHSLALTNRVSPKVPSLDPGCRPNCRLTLALLNTFTS
jgi:hypothetical protein